MSVPEADVLHTLVVLSPTDVWVTGQSWLHQPGQVQHRCVAVERQHVAGASDRLHRVATSRGTSATDVWAVGLGDLNSKGEGTLSAYRWTGTQLAPGGDVAPGHVRLA